LKRYNVSLAVEREGRTERASARARERKRKTCAEESLDCIYRASINQLTRDYANTSQTLVELDEMTDKHWLPEAPGRGDV